MPENAAKRATRGRQRDTALTELGETCTVLEEKVNVIDNKKQP